MWTARGKMCLKLLNDLTRYLLAFLAPNYLSNSQSYDLMNFGVSLGKNWPKIVKIVKCPLCVPPGENHFATGVPHDFVPPPQIS